MFWGYKITAILLFLSVPFFYSCTENRKTTESRQVDTSGFINWKMNLDTFYEKYSNSGDTKYARELIPFADSLMGIETLFSDTGFRKKYVSINYRAAVCFHDLGNFIRGRECFDRYLSLYKEFKIDAPILLAYVQFTNGNIYSRYGDYKKATRFLQQSQEYYRQQKDHERMAACLLNTSIALKELHYFDDAEDSLKKIHQLTAIGPKRKAKACIELADIYLRENKIPEAEVQLQKAKEFLVLMPGDPERTGIYSTLFSVEGSWFLADKRPFEALSSYRRSIDSAKVSSGQNLRDREIGKTYIAMGNAFLQLHSYDSALLFYNRALYTVINIDTLDKLSLPQKKDLYAENTIAEALYARAACISARGTENKAELENAVNCFKLAFETERKLLDAFSYDESRQQMLEATRKQTEKAIGICYRLYQKTKKSKWAAEAFLFAEHNKSFILTESVRRNTAASIYLQHDSLYEKLQSLRSELSMIETELGKQQAEAKPDTALTRSLLAAKEKNELVLLETENNLRIKNPAYTNWLANETSITAEELILRTLSSGNRLIEYFTGDSSIYAFPAEKDKPLGFYMLPEKIKSITGSFLHYFSNRNMILNDPAGYATAANDLYQSVLAPYMPAGSSTLLIIPDGFISLIPFDALLTSPATSANISAFPFLIKQQENHYAFSCRTLVEQANNKSNSTVNTVTAFAPVFAGRERGLAPLLNSSSEIEAVKQLYPEGKFFNAGEATLKKFEQVCSNTAIIHLATHAGTGNTVAIPGIEFYDSTLYLNRIYSMPVKAKLVVLSGCETGTGSINKTEGLMSLARGFSYAGTKNVIGSLWPTDDRVSAEIFKDFYADLDNDDFSTALHKAKLAAIENASAASASPYFWSGYIYIGSPDEKINNRSSGWIKYLLLAGILLPLVYFILRRRRNKN